MLDAVNAPLATHVERAASGLCRRLERHWLAFLVGLGVTGVSTSVLLARGRPFWHDEIVTILISGLPSLSAIWRAELDGVDFFPPLNDFMTHGVHWLFGTGPIVTRLPAIGGFWGMSLVVFEIVRRRSSPMTALAAFAAPFLTGAFLYSYEARGYGLMLALFALVLFTWLEAARGNRRRLYLPILSVALAASIWNHYFGILALLPLMAGEGVRVIRRRAPDWGMCTSVAGAALLVLPLWPLIEKTRVDASPVLRPDSSLRVLLDTYRFLTGFLIARRFLALAAVAVIVAAWRSWRSTSREGFARQELPAHEVVAGLTCLAIPVAAVAVGAAHGVFYNRYALPFTVGLAIVLPLAIWRLSSNRIVQALMGVVFAASFAQIGAQRLFAAPPVLHDAFHSHPVIAARLHDSEPIVVTGVEYLPLWYYAPQELRPRLWYVADPEATLKTFGTGTWDHNLLALRRYAPVNVAEYSSFAATASRFLVFSTRVEHWLLPRLARAGAEIVQRGSEGGVPIYEVSFRGRGSSSVDRDPARERGPHDRKRQSEVRAAEAVRRRGGDVMVLQVRGRLEGDTIAPEMDLDQLGRVVATRGIAVLQGVFDRTLVKSARDHIMAWGRSTQELAHGTPMQHVSPDLNYHRTDNDPTKSSAPHIHRHFNFNRFDLLSEPLRSTLFAAFEPLRRLQNRLAGTAARFSPTSDRYKLRPQVIQYPSGGGFFSEHCHALEPQRIGLVLALSQRGIDYKTGAACFRIGNEEIDTDAVHDAGDILLFRYDVPHFVRPVDPDTSPIDWRSPAGRWSLILPYY